MFKQKWLFVFFLFFLSYFSVNAATTTASFPIEATVLSEIQLSVLQNMDFGKNTVVTSNTSVNPTQPAQIKAIGNANANVAGSFNTSSVSLNCRTASTCGNDTITVDTFTCSGTGFNADCTGTISNTAESVININAVMHLTPANRVGTYLGQQTFSLVYT